MNGRRVGLVGVGLDDSGGAHLLRLNENLLRRSVAGVDNASRLLLVNNGGLGDGG